MSPRAAALALGAALLAGAVLLRAPGPPGPTTPAPPAAPDPAASARWVSLPPLRAPNPALSPAILADVDCHVPNPDYWRSADRGNWAHEALHGVNARARQAFGRPALYLGDSRALLMTHPRTTIRQVAQKVPASMRGSMYSTYCVSQASGWNAEPLYLWDEWGAYLAGALVDQPRRRTLSEYLPIALAVPLAAELDADTAGALAVLWRLSLERCDRSHPYLAAIAAGEDGRPYRELLARARLPAP